jgi:hypothetical protein
MKIPVKSRTITFLIAPDVPQTELAALEAHWDEAVADPTYVVVVNYDIRIDQVVIPEGSIVLIVAPGAPVGEIPELRNKIMNPETTRIAVNYELFVECIPQ